MNALPNSVAGMFRPSNVYLRLMDNRRVKLEVVSADAAFICDDMLQVDQELRQRISNFNAMIQNHFFCDLMYGSCGRTRFSINWLRNL